MAGTDFVPKPLEAEGGEDVQLLQAIAGNTSSTSQNTQNLSDMSDSLSSIDSHADAIETATEASQTALETIDDTVAITGSAIPAKALAVAGTDGTNARILKTKTTGELEVYTKHSDTLANGTIDAIAETASVSVAGLASCGVQITGTWVGTLEFEGTTDGTNYVQVRAVQFGGTLVGGATVNGLFFIQVGGLLTFRVRASAWTSGTATIYLEATAATNAITLANALPAGTNVIGQTGIDQTTDGTTNKVISHAYSLTETAVTEASITASGDSGTLAGSYGQFGEIYALLGCGTVSGTNPTLDVKIQSSVDGTTWTDIVSFAQLTGSDQTSVKVISRYYAADAQKAIANKLKVVWTIGGTDTPTFGTVTVKWTCKR